MTYRESEAAARRTFVWAAILLAMAFALAAPARADTLAFKIEPATKDRGGAALTAKTAITSHRVQYGTCTTAGAFDAPLGVTTVVMPIVDGFFTVPSGLYCLRAFASNKYGEGKPYPVSVIGPVPGEGGSVTVTVTSP